MLRLHTLVGLNVDSSEQTAKIFSKQILGINCMNYRAKEKVVQALPVGFILETASSDFRKLPSWIKKAYQDGKIFFGFSILQVNEDIWRKKASSGEILILDPDTGLKVMSQKDFHQIYETVASVGDMGSKVKSD